MSTDRRSFVTAAALAATAPLLASVLHPDEARAAPGASHPANEAMLTLACSLFNRQRFDDLGGLLDQEVVLYRLYKPLIKTKTEVINYLNKNKQDHPSDIELFSPDPANMQWNFNGTAVHGIGWWTDNDNNAYPPTVKPIHYLFKFKDPNRGLIDLIYGTPD